MLNTLAVVQIRAERLPPRWSTWRGLGGKSLVEWVVRRVADCARMDGILVACAAAEFERVSPLVPPDVPCFASQRPDALGQFTDTLLHVPCLQAVRVCLEHPFVDPELMDRLVTQAALQPHLDYIGYGTSAGQPAVESPIGCFAELCKTKALRIADRDATLPADRAGVTRYLYTHPERFAAQWLPMPTELDRADVRLALWGDDDREHCEDLYEALDGAVDYQTVTRFLHAQPHLRRRMAAMNQQEAV
ncbi:MAG: hypothetical protein SFX18_09115 [Pirellulales bacterium]|nr:hypothetical protein [Pirellulales bacterium]